MNDFMQRAAQITQQQSLPFVYTYKPRGTKAQRDALDQARIRLQVVAWAFVVVILVLAGRLADVSVIDPTQQRTIHAQIADGDAPPRGEIFDRNGQLLATTLVTPSLFVDPTQVIDPKVTAELLVKTLPDLKYGTVLKQLQSDGRFVWIKRNLTPRQQYEVNKLGLPGLDFRDEARRVYPSVQLTAQLLGYTDRDQRGIAGIEQSFNKTLSAGERLDLSIDLRLQHIVARELDRAITEFNGIGGAGAIMDVMSGEVLALVSLPSYDPHNPGNASADAKFNRATLGVYEPGSTFKIFNSALALQSGKIHLVDQFDATHPIRIGRHQIADFKPENRWLNVVEIFTHSSNIGSARMVRAVGSAAQQQFIHALGFASKLPLELPELGTPLLPAEWRDINAMTIAFGHGIAVTPMHNLVATASVINGGTKVTPTLIKRHDVANDAGIRVIDPAVSAEVRKLMRAVVMEGTGANAAVPGYLVGGKTGTAEKLQGGGYSRNARISSFIGAFPMHQPRYVILMMVDEPKPNKTSHGYATGGWVAAPAAGRVIAAMGPLYGLWPINEQDSAVTAALAIGDITKGKRFASE